MTTVDPVIPISRLISRLERHMENLQESLDKLPWYCLTRKNILRGAIATYQFEINAALELAAKEQPFFRSLKDKTNL